MPKNVLILSGSPRKGGNSDLLCEEFLRGALEAGNKAEKISVASKKISPCRACYYCRQHDGVCVLKDDMAKILAKVHAADVLVLASPVYFYSCSAQIKTVIDRMVAQWTQIKDKEIYYIMTSAESSDTVMDCTLECLRGLAYCLEGSVERGAIMAKGFYEPGSVKGSEYMQQAYELGWQV